MNVFKRRQAVFVSILSDDGRGADTSRVVGNYRSEITGQLSQSNSKAGSRKALFSWGWIFRRRSSASGSDLGRSTPWAELQRTTILFIPRSAPSYKLETDWARGCDKTVLRRCPACERDSIIGHGRRRKQAHDEHHDWIGVRRGRGPGCEKTFTFLPLFSLPYTHYSWLARCQALRRRFVEHCSWEAAAPTLKDSNRAPDPSTLRRWSNGLERSQRAASFRRQTLARVGHWLTPSHQADHQAWLWSWLTPVLQILAPLRL